MPHSHFNFLYIYSVEREIKAEFKSQSIWKRCIMKLNFVKLTVLTFYFRVAISIKLIYQRYNKDLCKYTVTYPSAPAICPCCSALILCRACAASSRAQLTDDVNFRNTSGSVNAFPSAVDNFPIPEMKISISNINEKHFFLPIF